MSIRTASRAALTVALIGALHATGASLAADDATIQSVQVPITASTPDGPSGLAVLTAADVATSVQVLVPDVAEGTTAVIHAGTCAQVGADPVGLIGRLGVSGQALGMVPVPLAELADGAHVVVLHPGMDLATAVGCGLIPTTAIMPRVVTPDDTPCAGVPEWVAIAEADLAAIKQRDDDLGLIFDPTELVNAFASNIGQAEAVVARMKQQPVPETALETHGQIVTAIEFGIQAAYGVMESRTSGDVNVVTEALVEVRRAEQVMLKARAALAQLKARCPG